MKSNVISPFFLLLFIIVLVVCYQFNADVIILLGPSPLVPLSRLSEFSQGSLCIRGCILGKKFFIFDKWVCAPQNSLQVFF
jgi:hypothetical protein